MSRYNGNVHTHMAVFSMTELRYNDKVNTIVFILNIPWTAVGVVTTLFSVPRKVRFSKNPLAVIFDVKSFWWYRMFFSRKPRGMAHGNIVLLDPRADEADLKHELIHVKQWMQEPLIYPFIYFFESFKHGYQDNKYEEEVYRISGSRQI